jgi:hypothetical protein
LDARDESYGFSFKPHIVLVHSDATMLDRHAAFFDLQSFSNLSLALANNSISKLVATECSAAQS